MKLALIIAIVGLAAVLLLVFLDRGDRGKPTAAVAEASGFGYKTAWYAVRGASPVDVADALRLRSVHVADWPSGVAASYDSSVFVTPPISTWVLATGVVLGTPFGADPDPWGTLLALSKRFGQAQVYVTHRVVDLHVWARADSGRLLRAYGYLGEEGRTLYDVGQPTPEEQQLGFRFFDERSPEAQRDDYWERNDLTYPDEESVMAIARKWSIAPIDISAPAISTEGLIGQQ